MNQPADDLDLNQVVAYNVRAAREFRGWTQEEFAEYLEPYLGQRITQAAVSSIERAWDGDRRREFDAHELQVFAVVFDLPIIWFFLPPPGEDRRLRGTRRRASELYALLLGRPHQLEPVYQRLRDMGIREPTDAEAVVEILTGVPSDPTQWSYKQRRKELLLALLDEYADGFDDAIKNIGEIVDYLRLAGLRGYVAAKTNDHDLSYRPEHRPTDEPPDTKPDHADEAAAATPATHKGEDIPT